MGKLRKYVLIVKNMVKENKKLCQILLAILIVLITIIVITSCLRENKTTGNNFNKGLAIQDGKWIYYVAVDGDEFVGINKIKENGKKIEKVFDGNVSELNIINNYIYCIEKENNAFNLIKLKTNGEDKQILARDIDDASILAIDKYVFYFKNGKLYRTNLNGTKKEKISDKNISYFQVVDNWIYYIYENDNVSYIAKMKLNGDKNQRVAKLDSENEKYQTLYIKGNKIYYIMAETDSNFDAVYYLYNMNKKGEKIEKICKLGTNIRYINMQEKNIYYTVSEDYDTHNVYTIEYNGTNKNMIKQFNSVRNLNITKEWMFFLGLDDENDTVMKMTSIDGEVAKQL